MSSKAQFILERVKKPKKKEVKKYKGQGLRIVDDEDAIPDYIASYNEKGDDSDEYNSADELPQIAGVKDERPDEIIAKEQFGNTKWKQLDEDPNSSSALVLRKNYDDDDEDLSPPRSHGHKKIKSEFETKTSSSTTTLSKSKSRRKYSDEDLSPPRSSKMLAIKQEPGSDDDLSPPRLRRDDLSPPRRSTSYGKGKSRDDDLSPPRMRRNNSNDLSPPRRSYNSNSGGNSRKRNYSDDMSPPRGPRRAITDGRRQDSDGDLSPPRLPKRKFDSPQSQSRNQRYNNDNSPPSRRYNNNSSSTYSRRDDSPPPSHKRRNNYSDGGNSNSRRSAAEPEVLDNCEPKNKALEKYVHGSSYSNKDKDSSSVDKEKTLEGKKAGLQRGANLKEELDELRRRDDEFFSQMDESISGRNATTRYRDKETGKLRDFEKEKLDKIEADKKLAERKKQYDQWGKGLKQVEEIKSRVESALHEMDKPLARTKDDSDLDDYLKKQERDGDPMLKFIERKKEKASGNISRKPRYTGPAPMPNRFGIPPGYRWDGVDRSNNYEKEWFSKINSKKAIQDEGYKWSCEDL